MNLYMLQTTDDEFDETEVAIGYPFLTLDSVADVVQDDDLVISGATNRADETLFIVSVSGHGTEETATPEVSNGTISATFDTTGWAIGSNYLVTVEDTDNTVSQQANFDVVAGVPNIVVTLDVTPTEANVGDSVTAKATATNAGTAEGSQTISIMLDGTEVKSSEVTLAPGDSETVEYTFTATDVMVGTHTIEVGGQSATLTVTSDTTTPETPPPAGDGTETPEPDGEDESTPGFEAVFAVSGLLAVAYLVLRRREE